MFNRLSSFAKYLIFIATFFTGGFLDKLINELVAISDANFIFIWIVPLIIFLAISAVHIFKIYSKLALILFPLFLGILGGLIYGSQSIFTPFFLFSLAVTGVGAGTGILFSVLFLSFFDKNLIEPRIKHKWMLILTMAIPFVFYSIHDAYNLMVFNPIENMSQIILNFIGLLLGLLFLILSRNIAKTWGWRTMAIFGILFSAFMFFGSLGGYRMNKLVNQIPTCTDFIKTECLNESGTYIFKN